MLWSLVEAPEDWHAPKKVSCGMPTLARVKSRLADSRVELCRTLVLGVALILSLFVAAAQLGQKVAVLDYVEPSAKGLRKK